MAQPLVGEARRGEKLQAFDLAEVRPLAEGEEIKKLRDIVPSELRRHVVRLALLLVQRCVDVG